MTDAISVDLDRLGGNASLECPDLDQLEFGSVYLTIPNRNIWGKRALLAITLAAALFLLVAVGAEAHARFLRSKPGPGAVVSKGPNRVDMWFTQDLFRRQGENWILVFGPGGAEVQSGEILIDDDDRHHMWVELKSPLEPGEYRVEWRNLSAEDGDDAEGEFSFTLDPQAELTSTPMLDQTETPFPPPSPAATATVGAATPVLASTDQPATKETGGCSLGFTPAFALAALGFRLRRRK